MNTTNWTGEAKPITPEGLSSGVFSQTIGGHKMNCYRITVQVGSKLQITVQPMSSEAAALELVQILEHCPPSILKVVKVVDMLGAKEGNQ